jgi:3-oxoacyl-[acyl-carrier-protein] synthase II
VILETEEHALARNAPVYAEIAGYGVTNDGYSLIRMEPTGKEAACAMNLALADAKTEPSEIDYINAHGSASPLTDKRETTAIKKVFSDRAYSIPVSSIKAMIGQSLGATGSLQVVTTALSISRGHIPPTINYEEQDPDCDLDYTPNTERRAENGQPTNVTFFARPFGESEMLALAVAYQEASGFYRQKPANLDAV